MRTILDDNYMKFTDWISLIARQIAESVFINSWNENGELLKFPAVTCLSIGKLLSANYTTQYI
jgi:hypothetical protein